MDVYRRGLKQLHYVIDGLTGFYGSKTVKKKNWEKSKSIRAEMDWAIKQEPQRPALTVYGSGRFNTRTKLASLHELFLHE
ncbi:hypothetical protein BGZ65_000431, partial [Modicella reniformis]